MIQLIKIEISKLKYPYIISLIIGILYSIIVIFLFKSGYDYHYRIEVWEESGKLFNLLFPLFAVIPTCWLMYFERKNNYLMYTLNRVNKRKYIIAKWLTTSVGGAFIVFCISIVGLITSLYIIPDIEPFGTNNAHDHFVGYYFVNYPLVYGVTLSIWRMVIAFFISTLGYVISLYINNIFIILTLPFIYSLLENFILSNLNVPYFRLVTSFAPETISGDAVTIGRLIIGPLLLIFCTTAFLFYFNFIKKGSIYKI